MVYVEFYETATVQKSLLDIGMIIRHSVLCIQLSLTVIYFILIEY